MGIFQLGSSFFLFWLESRRNTQHTLVLEHGLAFYYLTLPRDEYAVGIQNAPDSRDRVEMHPKNHISIYIIISNSF